MNTEIEALANELVSTRFEQEPLEAALLGLSEGSQGLADLSVETERAMADSYTAIAARAETLTHHFTSSPSSLDERDRLTLDLIRLTAGSTAEMMDVPYVEFTVTDFHNAPLSSLIAVIVQLPLDTVERRDAHLHRLESIPRYLEQAMQRHLDGVAAGRTPTSRGVRGAIAQIDKVVVDPDLSGLRRRGVDDLDGTFASTQDQLVDGVVIAALLDFKRGLEVEILPAGRSDEQPGLCWLPDGDDMYRRLVRSSTSTDRTAEDLHATGLAIIERLNDEFAQLGERLWATRDIGEIHERLRTDPALRYTSSDEILAMAMEAVDRAERTAPDWFGLIPASACVVEPVPAALADGAPPAYYFTGALDGSRPGTYFVNTTRPVDRFRHMAEAVAFHEAVPGHHFQLTIAQELEGNHLVHSVFGDVATAEGWGLYAERLADEMGLYSSDVTRLGMVSTDAWRAARLVLDTGLHSMGWSRQHAIDWMTAHVPMSSLEIATEVDRYIVMPGQALSYMVGRLEIEDCRREATERLGQRFDVRSFHDQVLRCGPVPLPALRAALRRWIDGESGSAS